MRFIVYEEMLIGSRKRMTRPNGNYKAKSNVLVKATTHKMTY